MEKMEKDMSSEVQNIKETVRKHIEAQASMPQQ